MPGHALQLWVRQAIIDESDSQSVVRLRDQEGFLQTRFHLLATLAAFVVMTGPIAAKDYPIKVTAARIGFPSGIKAGDKEEPSQATQVAKFATWAPVYVDLELNTSVKEPAELVIEAADPDEINTTLSIPLRLAGVGTGTRIAAADIGCIGFIRPASVGEVGIFIREANGGKQFSEPFRIRSLSSRDPLT